MIGRAHDGHVRLGPFGPLRAVYDRKAVEAVADATPTEFQWDGGPWLSIDRSPITNRCAGAGNAGFWMRDFGAGTR